MKYKFFTAIAVSAMAIISCSTDTDTLGGSLTNSSDQLMASTETYYAYTHSLLVDSVYARSNDTYFGRVKDPETGDYVKTEFMAQFNLQESLKLPTIDNMLSKDDDGNVVADSCEIWLLFDRSSCFGDSLAAIKMNILELSRPMSETETYYTNFDPRKEGYIREDGMKETVIFSLSNLTYPDSIRKTSGYSDIARISLSEKYKAQNGKTYDNYGTYLLRTYYDHPEYYKNAYSFTNYVCPGFFFELADGLGLMAKFSMIEMRVFYHYKNNSDKTVNSYLAVSSTAEVLQTTQVTNDKKSLARLAADQSCTYLKAPAGIFTEVTLPVDEIMQNHSGDSLLSVSMTFQRQNSGVKARYLLSAPSKIMMTPTDSVEVFFEQEKKYDYKTTFMTSLSTTNSYTFSNIGNLITTMGNKKKKGVASDPDWEDKHPSWNKVLLIPVTETYLNSSGTESIIENQMGLVSTKLMGGSDTPIDVKVIYGRFNNQ